MSSDSAMDEVLPLWFRGLTPELKKKAEAELNETDDVREDNLQQLKQLIKDSKNLHCRLDDLYLLQFLRLKKHSVPSAFKLLRSYLTFKTRHDGVYTGVLPSRLTHLFDRGMFVVPPWRLPSGSHIAMFRVEKLDLSVATTDELLACMLVIMDLVLEYEATQVAGCVLVVDCSNASLQHYLQMANISFASFLFSMLQDCLPLRVAAVHLFNEAASLKILYNLVRPLIKKKMRERMHFHGNDMESLFSHIPSYYFPKDMGGSMESDHHGPFMEHLAEQEPFFEKMREYGVLQKKHA